jgi:hypothetical protein
MRELVTSHVASVPPRPEWVAFTPRAILAACSCALMINGVWYARGACNVCHGAGHRSLAMEVRGG